MGALRTRLGITEGQTYTLAILVVVVALLLSSLTGLTGRLSGGLAATPQPTTTTTTAPAPTIGELPPLTTLPPVAPPGATVPFVLPVDEEPAPFEPGEPEPPKAACATASTIDAVRTTLVALDELVGGVIPDATVVSTLALATGCSATDPTILLLAGLIEIGQSLPNLGLEWLELPVLPFIEVPEAVVLLVQPLRPLLDPVCNTAATVNVITSQVGPAYQAPIDALISISLFYALATCGQLQI